MVLAPVGAACTLPDLWHRFGWALAKGALDGALDGLGLQENTGAGYAEPARSVWFHGRGLAATYKSPY